MNHHHLAEERSLAYHAVVAARLATRAEMLQDARRRVATWLEAGAPGAPHEHHARAWAAILASPIDVIQGRLLDTSGYAPRAPTGDAVCGRPRRARAVEAVAESA